MGKAKFDQAEGRKSQAFIVYETVDYVSDEEWCCKEKGSRKRERI